jgi:hypothetical protein
VRERERREGGREERERFRERHNAKRVKVQRAKVTSAGVHKESEKERLPHSHLDFSAGC